MGAKRIASGCSVPLGIMRALFVFLLVGLLPALAGCSESPERIAHNNPERYELARDVLWASPDGFDLTMNIYTPNHSTAGDGERLPVIVMFHGGGWLVNDNSIMRQAAAYLVTHGRYVVCNVNYRLLGDQGNTVTLNQIVEDAMGAVLWVKENIATYGGDPAKVVVTGDSAGAHLSAMIVNNADRLSSTRLSADTVGFEPSYLPPATTAEALAERDGLAVQAAILSYGLFDVHQSAAEGYESWRNPFWLMGGSLPRPLFGDAYSVAANPQLYKALSPSHTIPDSQARSLPPQLLTVGTQDTLTTPASVARYAAALEQAGHTVELWQYDGRPHAFLDSGSNRLLGIAFEQDAPAALDVMLRFLDQIFFPGH